ncbi:MAG: DUF3800 domain-containing protein [Lachnospiraceae bacterium]|nr:DUF3800 domain-containing protein [Lachnospiraceae bacterium]
MKEEYLLYLDESEHRNSKNFTIAGFAIKKSDIHNLENELANIKKLIWTDTYISNNSPILHCTDLNNIYVNRKNLGKLSSINESYNLLAQKTKDEIERIYNQIYYRLAQLVRTQHITIFSCIINISQLNELFRLDDSHNGLHLIDDKYNIALQKIIESYTHYLTLVDGCGDVIYESRNVTGENSINSPDIKLINSFHQIHANNRGITYTSNKIVQERNRVFTTSNKNSNIAGLQLADFIAYNILKFYSITDPSQVTDFMKQLHRFSYNGGYKLSEKDQRGFWGMRVIPSYPQINTLSATNNRLDNAYSNLKKERNRLKIKIAELEQQNQDLKIKLKQQNSSTKKSVN